MRERKASVMWKHHHLLVTEVGNMQVVGKSQDFSLKKHPLGRARLGKHSSSGHLGSELSYTKGHMTYLKEITSLSVGSLAKKNFRARKIFLPRLAKRPVQKKMVPKQPCKLCKHWDQDLSNVMSPEPSKSCHIPRNQPIRLAQNVC